jgi:hypothetical protein
MGCSLRISFDPELKLPSRFFSLPFSGWIYDTLHHPLLWFPSNGQRVGKITAPRTLPFRVRAYSPEVQRQTGIRQTHDNSLTNQTCARHSIAAIRRFTGSAASTSPSNAAATLDTFFKEKIACSVCSVALTFFFQFWESCCCWLLVLR